MLLVVNITQYSSYTHNPPIHCITVCTIRVANEWTGVKAPVGSDASPRVELCHDGCNAKQVNLNNKIKIVYFSLNRESVSSCLS